MTFGHFYFRDDFVGLNLKMYFRHFALSYQPPFTGNGFYSRILFIYTPCGTSLVDMSRHLSLNGKSIYL